MSKKLFNSDEDAMMSNQMNDEAPDVYAASEKLDATDISYGTKIGTVVNCARLNVREEADSNSMVLAVIDKGEKVSTDFSTLDLAFNDLEKNDMWCAVTTQSGVRGFCMKEYISIENNACE